MAIERIVVEPATRTEFQNQRGKDVEPITVTKWSSVGREGNKLTEPRISTSGLNAVAIAHASGAMENRERMMRIRWLAVFSAIRSQCRSCRVDGAERGRVCASS